MKIIGLALIIIGIILCAVTAFSFIKQQSKIVSPIPETEGVKVIIISPGE